MVSIRKLLISYCCILLLLMAAMNYCNEAKAISFFPDYYSENGNWNFYAKYHEVGYIAKGRGDGDAWDAQWYNIYKMKDNETEKILLIENMQAVSVFLIPSDEGLYIVQELYADTDIDYERYGESLFKLIIWKIDYESDKIDLVYYEKGTRHDAIFGIATDEDCLYMIGTQTIWKYSTYNEVLCEIYRQDSRFHDSHSIHNNARFADNTIQYSDSSGEVTIITIPN